MARSFDLGPTSTARRAAITGLGQRRLNRRALMGTAAAGGLALAGSRLGARALAQGDTTYGEYSDLSGQQLNFVIIQPHQVTGDLLAEDFAAATGAQVNVQVVPYDEVQARVTLDVQSGANTLDVVDYWYPTLGALATQGIIEDLTDYIAEHPDINEDDFIPSIYDVYTLYEGRRYGLPYDGDTHVLFYNTTILERNGFTEPPRTWDEYAQIAQTITETESADGVYGGALLGFQVPIILGSSYSNRLAGFGGRFLNDDGSPALDSDAAVAAAQALLDAAPYALPTPLETAFDEALPAFLSGQVAMIEFWTDLGIYAQDESQSQIVDQWDVVPVPVGGDNETTVASLNAGFCFGVSTGSQNKEAAREFVRFATSQAYNLKLVTTTGSGIDPTRISNLESDEFREFAPKVQAAASASLNGAFAWPTIPETPDLMQVLTDELALLILNEGDAGETLANVQAQWESILGG